jgi:putative phosphoribosyl transferase
MSEPRFADRRDAGRALAGALEALASTPDLLVLGLARGGVPVAFEVARKLGAELDVLVVRKLGLPQQPELAMGAIGAGGVLELNPELIVQAQVSQEALDAVVRRERLELQRRETAYRGDRPPPRLKGRCIVLVDDGIATGASIRAALDVLRRAQPARIVVAAPVAAAQALLEPSLARSEVVTLARPWNLGGVGRFYEDFGQTGDDEVRRLLERSASASQARHAAS